MSASISSYALRYAAGQFDGADAVHLRRQLVEDVGFRDAALLPEQGEPELRFGAGVEAEDASP
jgi:hypothetical protein